MYTIDGEIVEIQGSHLDSNKVAIGGKGRVYVTEDAGVAWVEAYECSGTNVEFKGFMVRGDEIQAVFMRDV